MHSEETWNTRNCTVLPSPSASVLQFPLKSIGRLPVSSPSWLWLVFETIWCACFNIWSALSSYIKNIASGIFWREWRAPTGKALLAWYQCKQLCSQLAVKSCSTHRKKASSPMVLRDLLHHPLKESTSSGIIKGKLMLGAVKAYSKFN